MRNNKLLKLEVFTAGGSAKKRGTTSNVILKSLFSKVVASCGTREKER